MATRTIVVSDYTGQELKEDEAVKVTLTVKVGDKAGEKFELDFAQDEIEDFLNSIKEGRIIPKAMPSLSTGRSAAKRTRQQSEEQHWLSTNGKYSGTDIRKWAEENDKKVSARGRISDDTIKEFREAMSK